MGVKDPPVPWALKESLSKVRDQGNHLTRFETHLARHLKRFIIFPLLEECYAFLECFVGRVCHRGRAVVVVGVRVTRRQFRVQFARQVTCSRLFPATRQPLLPFATTTTTTNDGDNAASRKDVVSLKRALIGESGSCLCLLVSFRASLLFLKLLANVDQDRRMKVPAAVSKTFERKDFGVLQATSNYTVRF